jgi:hypothetical protein
MKFKDQYEMCKFILLVYFLMYPFIFFLFV